MYISFILCFRFQNRKYLEELSRHNAQLLKIIESSVVMACLDNHSPKDYSESSQLALTGDFHSKWADRSNIMVIFRNGKISLIGEVFMSIVKNC